MVCSNVILEENVIDLPLSINAALRLSACGTMECFANQSPAALIQGYINDTNTYVAELSTNVEDAALLAF
jgi:hypothetical protein